MCLTNLQALHSCLSFDTVALDSEHAWKKEAENVLLGFCRTMQNVFAILSGFGAAQKHEKACLLSTICTFVSESHTLHVVFVLKRQCVYLLLPFFLCFRHLLVLLLREQKIKRVLDTKPPESIGSRHEGGLHKASFQ